MKLNNSVGGSFDFESIITNLFRDDISLRKNVNRDKEGMAHEDYLMAFTIAQNAKRGANTLSFLRLPDDLSNDADATLFHERIHYWQMIACPLQQYKFLVHLDELRKQLVASGGSPLVICGQDRGFTNLDDLEEAINSVESNFGEYDMTLSISDLESGNFPDIFNKVRLVSLDWITHGVGEYAYVPGAQVYLHFPRSNTQMLPGYGAMLYFSGHDKVVIIPFTGKYLMESAAYLSELLYEEKPFSKPSELDNHTDKLYFGAFEFWRRLHGHRYDSEANLIMSFLAAVDLAISSDVVELKPTDGEFQFEMSSIPYRFGKLAYRIQGIEPLKCEQGEEPSLAVGKFQERICEYNGWPSPDFTIKKMAIALSRSLISAHARFIPHSDEYEKILNRVFDEPLSQQAESFEDLLSFWDFFNSEKLSLLGQSVIGTMLNACLYRINNPGEFALPHIYCKKITAHFPLPLVLYKGSYYFDQNASNSVDQGYPYPVTSMETAFDLISLMTIKPLKYGAAQTCGFLSELIDCWYIKSKLGCPLIGFTKDQKRIRQETGLDDWCHYTFQSVLQKTASSHVLNKWQTIWKESLKD